MTLTHPCYGGDKKKYARVHLPVAPACNLGCNYCNRKYDCANESRPGVTSSVIGPYEALLRFIYFKETLVNITVAGIAGPGDPLANREATSKTLFLVKRIYPDVHLCISTNGTLISENIDWISSLGVKHVTVTVNASNASVAKRIYRFLVKEGKVLKGQEMAETIINSQFSGIRRLSALGVSVKVNTVFIPGINDDCILEIASKVLEFGASIFNLIPFIPVEGSFFWKQGVRNVPSPFRVKEVKEKLRNIGVPLLDGCGKCRSDAAGFIGEGKQILPYIGIASSGRKVDSHFGKMEKLLIFDRRSGDLVEKRVVRIPYNNVFMNDFDGVKETFRALKGCGIVVVKDIGFYPEKVLKSLGVKVIKTEMAVDKILELLNLKEEFAGRY
ncbi:radical SAM protein [Desulfurobacterium sp.]